MSAPQFFKRQAWIANLHDARWGIPYGVVLAEDAFILLSSAKFFRLAATS